MGLPRKFAATLKRSLVLKCVIAFAVGWLLVLAFHKSRTPNLKECKATRLFYGLDSSSSIHESKSGLRVLIVTGAYNNVVDGVSRTLNRLVRHLDAQGYKTLIVAPRANGSPAMPHYGTLMPAQSISLPHRKEYSLSFRLDACMWKLIEDFNPQIVHVATPDIVGSELQKWAIATKRRVVCSYHTRFNSYLQYYMSGFALQAIDSLLWRWMRGSYNKCSHVYPPTNGIGTELVSHGIRKEKIRLWPRGIDLKAFSSTHRSDALRREWGVTDPNTAVILIVTRMVREKNLELFAKVVKHIYEEEKDLKFVAVIAGSGPALPELKAMLPQAKYVGHKDGEALSRTYASADIFFFPSVTETWGSVTLEAMASGLAVVVAGGPSGSDLLINNVTGLKIDTNCLKCSQETLELLIANRSLRQRLATEAAKTVLANSELTWQHANTMLETHYNEVINNK